LVAVGRVGKAHGIRGDVFVEPWTDDPDDRFAAGSLLRTGTSGSASLTVASSRDHSGKLVVHFEGIDDRNAAETLRGTVLHIPASARPPIDDPDEFYDTDLIGLNVRTVSGDPVGVVADVIHSPASSLLSVEADGREVLVPFLRQFVPVVDLEAKVIEIDPPEGLLDLDLA
jgi:16S rRNA processing protein RimM